MHDAEGPVPFLDLITPHLELEDALTDAFRQAVRTAAFVGGPAVDAFERDFAAFCAVDHCAGVANGTDAVLLALRGAGIGPGQVVVTVPNTFIATTEAIVQAGARPEFVDVDERTFNLDPARLERYLERDCVPNSDGTLTSRRSGLPVTAVVPVHLYGQMADMDPILALAQRFRLTVIEDACQAHGAEYFSRAEQRWQRAGSVGQAAAFSFYPGKNLGACGEAGAVTTNDPAIAERVKKLRDHGQSRKYIHELEGYNARLDAIQAAFLGVKLARLPEWNAGRRARAAEYRRLFASGQSAVEGASVIAPYEPDWSRAIYHLYVIRVSKRDALVEHLRAAGIGTGLHYPVPLHVQEAHRGLGYRPGDFPISERLADEIVSLPMYPNLTPEQQARVAAAVTAFLT